jgi:hypothetical protein
VRPFFSICVSVPEHPPFLPPTVSQEQRMARTFPEEAVLHCRSVLTALSGNLPDQASGSLLRALALNPMIWEAFEGLCTLGESARRILRPALLIVRFASQDPYQKSRNCSLRGLLQSSGLPQMNS